MTRLRLALLALIVVALVAACYPPAAPIPPTGPAVVTREPLDVDALSRGVGSGSACAVPGPYPEHQFPRLWANYAHNTPLTFKQSDVAALSLFDIQMWMMDSPYWYENGKMTNWANTLSPWEYAKSINANTKIFAYVPGMYMWANPWACGWHVNKCDIQEAITTGDAPGDDWWIHDPDLAGGLVSPWVNYESLTNVSEYDDYAGWYGEYIASDALWNKLDADDDPYWDGIHLDVANSAAHALCSTKCDIDENNLRDQYEAGKGKPWINV